MSSERKILDVSMDQYRSVVEKIKEEYSYISPKKKDKPAFFYSAAVGVGMMHVPQNNELILDFYHKNRNVRRKEMSGLLDKINAYIKEASR